MRVVSQGDNRSHPTEKGKFTDGVWQEELLGAQSPEGMRAHRFFYAPNAHSHWHSHAGEQTLYFVSGTGRIKKEGEEAFHVQPGDLVYVAPGEKHWHGATQDQFLVHFAFTASGRTQWLEEVTEAEYLSEP